ncbi:MAG: hypothetical protein Q4D04_15970, partial [Clostridia bacterium]|nr:hypothetical protein [Clostridia bacterium]
MADYFVFKGIKSTDYGVYVTEFPPIPIPVERVEYKQIPGRAGTIAICEGEGVYDDVTFTVSCFIANLDNLAAISNWLTGSGELILGNMPDKMRKARVSRQIDIVKLMRGRTAHIFDVTFRCDPVMYAVETGSFPVRESGTTIPGEGVADAEPIIVVTGTGDITLTVGDRTLTIEGLSGSITIDS